MACIAAGIEEIGVQIEEPFSILALENLVGTGTGASPGILSPSLCGARS